MSCDRVPSVWIKLLTYAVYAPFLFSHQTTLSKVERSQTSLIEQRKLIVAHQRLSALLNLVFDNASYTVFIPSC